MAAGVKEIGQLSPDTIRGYMELSSAGQKKKLLGAKTRELIALAVAVTLRCDGCITVHSEAAIKQGASKDEIAEALGVAAAVNAGAALVYSTRDGRLQGISASSLVASIRCLTARSSCRMCARGTERRLPKPPSISAVGGEPRTQ